MWTVVKQIPFSYSHRLLDYDGPCRQMHGHNGLAEIVCEGESLDDKGMVADFARIKRVMKGYIDEHLDHRLLLKRDDPMVAECARLGQPVFLFDENPTAEVMARHLYEIALAKGLPVVEVRLHETPTSVAAYRETRRP